MLDERVAFLRSLFGERVLTVVCTHAQNSSSEYPPFLESLEKVLESAPTGHSSFLLGDFNAHVGNDSETWRGVTGNTGLSGLNLSSVQLLDSVLFTVCPITEHLWALDIRTHQIDSQ